MTGYSRHLIMLGMVCAIVASRSYGSGALQLTLSTNVESLAVCEPIALIVIIENVGDEAVTFRTDLFREEPAGGVIVRTPSGATLSLRRPEYRGRVGSRPGYRHLLAPGVRFECSFLLAMNYGMGDEPVFRKPGRYTLTVEYDDEGLEAKSNPLEIEVFEPPETDREALERVKSLSFLPALYEPDMIYAKDGVAREELLHELNVLAEDKESKIYANYARFGLSWVEYMVALEEFSSAAQSGEAFEQDHASAFWSQLSQAKQYLAAIDSDELTIQPRIIELHRAIAELEENWHAAEVSGE